MRKARRTSRRYRGAKRGGVGVLIPVLVVLCIAAATVLYFINDNMTFTLDGTQLSSGMGNDLGGEVDANLIIEAPAEDMPAEENTPAAETPSDTAPEQDNTDVRALFIPIGEVKSAELLAAKLAETGADKRINTLVLEVKAEDGTLAFSSDSPIAAAAAVSGDDATLTAAIKAVRDAGYRVSLYMSCFKDNEAARKSQEYSARTANKIIWLDNGNVRWLSAYSTAAREYLISAVKKLASFLPDEIVLSNVSLPAEGKTELLAYDKSLGTKQEMIESFIKEVKTAAGSVPLSAVYENYNDACVSESGQTPEMFSTFERLYVSEAAGKFRNGGKIAREHFDGSETVIIPVSPAPSQDEFMIK
ncbi:MAG: hypothetical protein IJ299_05405 [Oscillospiraceae bacterium]|nr:hypothetical protein [Oscillospiraceae bacterium]